MLLAVVMLTGCATPTPMPTAPPAPSEAPVFASDEEALAAAEEAYGAYMSAADEVIRGGGLSPELVEPYLSADLYQRDRESFEQFADNGWTGTGQATFTMRLQDFDSHVVISYVCDDYSQTDVVNGRGESVVDPNRTRRFPHEVTFSVPEMRIVSKELWNGGGVC